MTKAERPGKHARSAANHDKHESTEENPSGDSEAAEETARSDEGALSDEEWKERQARRIYYMRAQTGLTQAEFAAVLGWSTSKQSQIEQNADAVRIRPLDVMAARFIAERPLEALGLARDISETVRDKMLSYAQQVEDVDVP